MIRRLLLAACVLAAGLAVSGWMLYRANATPAVEPISAAEALAPTRPFVVKFHAQWCPVCMTTKGMWTRIEETYGNRVNLVVFDFTDEATTAASHAEALRLGLEAVYDANHGWTGTILVVDGRTKTEVASIHGSRDFADYRASIDAVIEAAAGHPDAEAPAGP